MTAGQAYNSITCLCGGSYIKDYQQGFKFCNDCGETDMLLEYVPEFIMRMVHIILEIIITHTNDQII